ncbi:hypothetical protein KC349_g290 [Hortaea werneckii]|nr:hypothetical protein KC349_g290 [Hortaea werneckii]
MAGAEEDVTGRDATLTASISALSTRWRPVLLSGGCGIASAAVHQRSFSHGGGFRSNSSFQRRMVRSLTPVSFSMLSSSRPASSKPRT